MLRSAAVWREDLVLATPRSRPGSRTEGSTLESKETTNTIVIYITSEPQPEPNGSARLLLVLRCWSRQDRCHRRHHRTSTLRFSHSALRPLDQQLAHRPLWSCTTAPSCATFPSSASPPRAWPAPARGSNTSPTIISTRRTWPSSRRGQRQLLLLNHRRHHLRR